LSETDSAADRSCIWTLGSMEPCGEPAIHKMCPAHQAELDMLDEWGRAIAEEKARRA
jgi:hypothetical protein